MTSIKKQKKKSKPSADKRIVRELNSTKKETKKQQRYVKAERVEFFKQAGWKIVNRDITKRVDGVRTHANDLILMEK